ncbi:hypothetical protein [Actinoplanes sp. M2I2]|uniref:hypothetical protein n=1 Tax=Actinoplanes sp. M2I2 TaxID=1734444 RepID=UPI00202145FF|nr:hypothetical protein [Actinoplanes sp. M2I2]
MRLARKLASLAIATLAITAGSLVATTVPASAAGTCRTVYSTAAWRVQPCVYGYYYSAAHGYALTGANAKVERKPAGCATYRVYLVDANNVQRFSTSARPCVVGLSKPVEVWNGEFGGGNVMARFIAYNSSGATILTLDTPYIHTTY